MLAGLSSRVLEDLDWATKAGKPMGTAQMIMLPEASKSLRLKLGLKLQDADGEHMGRGSIL